MGLHSQLQGQLLPFFLTLTCFDRIGHLQTTLQSLFSEIAAALLNIRQ
jgi:hypothetical protein